MIEYYDPTDSDRPPLKIDVRWYPCEESKLIKRYLACHYTILLDDEDAEPEEYINSIHDSREELHTISAAPIGQAAQDGLRPLYESDASTKKRRISADSPSGSILMDVLGKSTRDLTPAGQHRHLKNSNPWPASNALPTNSSTRTDTHAFTESSSTMQEEDNENQDAAEEANGKGVREQFLKTSMAKPAPATAKPRQSAASNMKHTKSNGATTTTPTTTPMAADSPNAEDAATDSHGQDTDGHNTPATSVQSALKMAEHRCFTDSRYLVIHGFKIGMNREMVLQDAHQIANVLGHQIDDAPLQEAMDNSHPWQIDAYDGLFGICVTLTHEASFVTSYSHHRDWLTLPTYTCRLGEVQEDGNSRRYHVQPSMHPPQFYMTGLREMAVIRGVPQKEEYVRH